MKELFYITFLPFTKKYIARNDNSLIYVTIKNLSVQMGIYRNKRKEKLQCGGWNPIIQGLQKCPRKFPEKKDFGSSF